MRDVDALRTEPNTFAAAYTSIRLLPIGKGAVITVELAAIPGSLIVIVMAEYAGNIDAGRAIHTVTAAGTGNSARRTESGGRFVQGLPLGIA